MKAITVKATSSPALNDRINTALSQVGDSFVDLKIAGSFDGEDESFVAVILYKD
ncbi:hypothetical protein ACSS6N_12150 [Peribacillus frigoritolerans]|uniref:hypothetical protein n=1 Tax=Peribacillus frigoritolerans TaxID=450367 RepID=UPI003F87EB14